MVVCLWKPGAGAVTVSYAADEPTNDVSTQPSSPETDRNERLGSKCLPVGPESRAMQEQDWSGNVHQEQAKVAATVLPGKGMRRELLTGLPAGRHRAGGNHRHGTRYGRSSKSMANWPEDENYFSQQPAPALPPIPLPC